MIDGFDEDSAQATLDKMNQEPLWYECQDDDGNIYYYNSKTQDCQWEKPDDFDDTNLAAKRPPTASEAFMKKVLEGKVRKGEMDVHKKVIAVQREQAKRMEGLTEYWVSFL
jgi:hypothetical protein